MTARLRHTGVWFRIIVAAIVAASCGGDGGTGGTTQPTSTPARITVSPALPVTLVSGATVTLSASVLTSDGRPITGQSVTWTTSDPAIATVSTSGVVTGALAGTASIVARLGSIASAAITVRVTPAAAARLALRTQPD